MSQLKSINFRGGLVRFYLPEAWQETIDKSGVSTFRDDASDGGMLRLNFLSFDSEGRQPTADMIASLITKDGFEKFQNGLAIKRSTTSSSEHGEKLEMRSWQVAVPVPPYAARLAIFSFTYLASRANDPAVERDVAMLEQSIGSGDFSRDEGPFEDPSLVGEFSPLSADDLAMLDAEREFANSVVESRFPNTQLLGTAADLEVLQQIFESGPYSDSAEGELVALGTSFGDLLARALELDWVCYTDASGSDIGLRYRETSIVLFPRDMIVKRVEQNQMVVLPQLYDEVIREVEKLLESGDFR